MNTGSQAIVSTVASILIVASPITVAGHDNQPPPQTEVDSKNIPNGTEFYGEVTEQVTEGGSSDSGEPPSQDHPTVTASDPSMWDEQPHHECSPKKNKNESSDYACRMSGVNRSVKPAEPAGGGDPRTITITTREAATLIAQGSGITRQPPGPKVIISKAFIVYTNPAVRYQTTTILGTPIEVEFTPVSYTWNWGDGTTTTTTDPGAPYPHQTVTHHYQHTATGVTTTLTTTWTTRFRPQGDTQWRPIEGTITTTETSTPYDLVRIITYLTDDAEEAQGH
ncbi:zinc transporter [Actinomyces sp. SKVG-SVH-4(1)]|uniref:zinc transporter n=1 Tax=Actinomyces sp. SKVG-SVH-4(1) TaxID=3240382 RepID=UPI003AF21ECD